MKDTRKMQLDDPMQELNAKLNSIAPNDSHESREELEYNASHLSREYIEENKRQDEFPSGEEQQRLIEKFVQGLSGDRIVALTPKDNRWKFVLASESPNSSPSMYELVTKGYSYVKPEECNEPNAYLLMKQEGNSGGYLRVREMVYMKIQKFYYDAAMVVYHHNMPALSQSDPYKLALEQIDRDRNRTSKRLNLQMGMKNTPTVEINKDEIIAFAPPKTSDASGVGIPDPFVAPTGDWEQVALNNAHQVSKQTRI